MAETQEKLLEQSSDQEAEKFAWYVLRVRNRFEKATREKILEIIKEEGEEGDFKDFLIPTEDIIQLVNGKKKEVEKLLYPSYIFVNMYQNPDNWRLLMKVPGVYGFINSKPGQPQPMKKREIEEIKSKLVKAEAEGPQLKTGFKPGEVVRVTEGPFNDYTGIVDSINPQRNRIKVSIQIFGRTTPVEMEINQVVREK